MSAERRTLLTEALARVEGEGAMYVRIAGTDVEEVQLRIYEPPRFFEALLRGRAYTEVSDITARICGICPVAYQLSACAAIEDACGAEVTEPIARLRRLIYTGEWIESHGLHVAMLHAPDFLGYDSAIALSRDHPGIVERGLRVKKAGNAIVDLVGGRAIHPVNVRVGGFHRAPTRRELEPLAEQLKVARDEALEAVRWAGALDFPDHEEDYRLVALTQPDEYAIEAGRLASSDGLDLGPAEYEEHFFEEQVPHSNALHSRLRDGGSYLCGPLARYGLSSGKLSPLAREAAADAGLGPVCLNPFQSIVVRSVEILFALDEAIRLIETYDEPDRPAVEVEPRAASGQGWTEAPRGLLYHRYRLAADGTVEEAKIVPPTSQNQLRIEEDLRAVVAANIALGDDALRLRCEQAIRNHDPCISCSTHFLKLEVDRR
ncbi:MAG: Ni/Fe hydrogenase subunit alpha [Thermoleophilaceae bacterium]|nr:Ni/Fe hydrogenase subunit alpha [Thermoleophilaceae bacterium]